MAQAGNRLQHVYDEGENEKDENEPEDVTQSSPPHFAVLFSSGPWLSAVRGCGVAAVFPVLPERAAFNSSRILARPSASTPLASSSLTSRSASSRFFPVRTYDPMSNAVTVGSSAPWSRERFNHSIALSYCPIIK